MKIKKALPLSIISALIFTIIDIFANKVGGLQSGGIRLDPHSWDELFELYPQFVFTFLISFAILLFWNKHTPETYYYICTNCEKGFSDLHKQKEITCNKCGGKAEISDDFYKRHPKFLDK